MAKYFLITVKRDEGYTDTFIEEGESTYDAFLLGCKTSKFLDHNKTSIIFSQEATKKDFELYKKHKKN